MDIEEFKKYYTENQLNITQDYGRIFTFIDFANVNNWFIEDRQDWDNIALADNEELIIDLKGLKNFADIFSKKVRCYYGEDLANTGSLNFSYVMRRIFGKWNFITKSLQRIKHYLNKEDDLDKNFIQKDKSGNAYIEIRKCNFDVEISVDVLKMLDYYDTICLFSADADFVYLNEFLRKKKKKIILVKSGYITKELRKSVDLVISAQKIKRDITVKKQRPDKSGLCG